MKYPGLRAMLIATTFTKWRSPSLISQCAAAVPSAILTSEFPAKLGTADTQQRSIQNGRECKGSMLRRIINDRLREFHRLLVAEFSSNSEDFLETEYNFPLCDAPRAAGTQPSIHEKRSTFSRA